MESKQTTSNEFVYDISNEIIILGAVKHSDNLRRELIRKLSPDEFLVNVHSLIWKSLINITNKSLELTPEIIRQFILNEGGDNEAVDYFNSLTSVDNQNLSYHIDVLKFDATRVRLLNGLIPDFLQNIKEPKATNDSLLSKARAITRALEGSSRSFIHKPSELYRDYKADISMRLLGSNVYPLGEEPFDNNLSEGFAPGKTGLIAGLSSSGKSTLGINFGIRLAKLGRKVMWCCWEMNAKSVMDVAISYLTGIELTNIVQGRLDSKEQIKVDKASKWLLNRFVFVGKFFKNDSDDRKKVSNNRNIDLLEGYIAESSCDVIFYDLWERMIVEKDPNAVTSALYRMQDLHELYGVNGIIINHINLKQLEGRSDKRPTEGSVKGVGSYVEASDLVIGVHREGKVKNVVDNTIETIVLKQRKGRANWCIRWDWNGAICSVTNPREVPYDPGLENVSEFEGGLKSIKSNNSFQNRRDK